jgi:ABC-type protease/lipase transport system fused ATPase/permease subunit
MEAGNMGLSGLNNRPSSTIFVIMLSIYQIALIVIALLRELINVLYHRGSFYILQVYRRVIDLHWPMDAGDVHSSRAGIRPTDTSLIAVLSAYRGALIGLALFSALINILYLTGSFYMLQVYDRVIPSRSVPTLIALSLLAGTLYAGQAALDFFRRPLGQMQAVFSRALKAVL